ncbi:hypothetical protein PG623_01000 [Riemerella anatipestifer]|nr:hypothetical protein [Riemerella anatipestifer]
MGSLSSSWTNAGTNQFIPHPAPTWGWVYDSLNNTSVDKNLWQKGGSTNPCPTGYHVPTHQEQIDLHDTIVGYKAEPNVDGNYLSNSDKMWQERLLRIPASGGRGSDDGKFFNHGISGHFSSSNSKDIYFIWNTWFNNQTSAVIAETAVAGGFNVRCIKD